MARRLNDAQELARINRIEQSYVESLAAIAAQLDVFESANDEAGYMELYDRLFTPTYVNCRAELGAELAPAVVRTAYALARVNA